MPEFRVVHIQNLSRPSKLNWAVEREDANGMRIVVSSFYGTRTEAERMVDYLVKKEREAGSR